MWWGFVCVTPSACCAEFLNVFYLAGPYAVNDHLGYLSTSDSSAKLVAISLLHEYPYVVLCCEKGVCPTSAKVSQAL